MRLHSHLYDKRWQHGFISTCSTGRRDLRVEWSIFQKQHAHGIGVDLGENFQVSANLGLWGVYVTLEGVNHKDQREFKFKWHNGKLWLTPWGRQMEWNSRDPWWIRGGSFDPMDFVFGRAAYEKVDLETREVEIPMPEGSYKGVAVKDRSTWKRPRAWWKRERYGWWIDVEGGVPAPGKWGEDGIFGTGANGHRVEEAIGNYVRAVLEMRVKHGSGHRDTGRRVAS